MTKKERKIAEDKQETEKADEEKEEEKEEKSDDRIKALTKEVEELQKKLKEKEKEIEELRDKLLRQQAEFENYKKFLDSEMEKFKCLANESLIKDLLPVLDSMELAIEDLKKRKSQELEGIKCIYQQMFKVLENHGLKPIQALGKMFDPYYHEVVAKVPSSLPEGIVVEELQKGYMLNLNVIRHSKVKISAGKGDGENG